MASTEFRVTFFPERVFAAVNEPGGRTSMAVQRTCRNIVNAAVPRIGSTYSGHHPGRGRRLQDSGEVVHNQGASWSAVFNHPIAAVHHNGARAHVMAKKTSGFYYRSGPGVVTSGGDTVFGPRRGPIHHPGHPGNPYLTDAAAQIGGRASGALRRGTTGPFPVFRLTGR